MSAPAELVAQNAGIKPLGLRNMHVDASPSNSSVVLDVLPKVVGGLVSLSAVGYFAGWRQTQTYYSSIGASWAASLIPPQALLQLSAGTMLAIVLGSFYSFILIIESKVRVRTLTWTCTALLLVATVFLLIAQGTFGAVSPQAASLLSSGGAILCAVTAGITITEFYAGLKSQQSVNSSGQLWLVFWFVLPGLFWAPDRLGLSNSIRDTDPVSSPLPKLLIEEAESQGTWRLVHTHEGRALIVQLSKKPEDRVFRLVDAKDIKGISFTSYATTKQ